MAKYVDLTAVELSRSSRSAITSFSNAAQNFGLQAEYGTPDDVRAAKEKFDKAHQRLLRHVSHLEEQIESLTAAQDAKTDNNVLFRYVQQWKQGKNSTLVDVTFRVSEADDAEMVDTILVNNGILVAAQPWHASEAATEFHNVFQTKTVVMGYETFERLFGVKPQQYGNQRDREVVECAVEALLSAGYRLRLEHEEPRKVANSSGQIMQRLFHKPEELLIAIPARGNESLINLVYFSDDGKAIADWGCKMEHVLDPAIDLQQTLHDKTSFC